MTVFDRLRRLEANATPGPWTVGADEKDGVRSRDGWVFSSALDWAGEVGEESMPYVDWLGAVGDPDFIVAARNLWGPLVAVASAAAEADDLLRRLSEWDMLSSYEGKPVTADGPYWQVEIARVRDALTALAALERAVKEQP